MESMQLFDPVDYQFALCIWYVGKDIAVNLSKSMDS